MQELIQLYNAHFGCSPDSIVPLTGSASNRRYFRLSSAAGTCIGVEGLDMKENQAFIELARHFRSKGLPVPEIYAVSGDEMSYIQEDLGGTQLFDMLCLQSAEIEDSLSDILCRTMALLPKFQFEGAEGLDFSVCYPEPSFSRRMVMFDLNYFKYCFLKASGLEFNEVLLQDDFEKMADDLLSDSVSGCEVPTFMYRDFQARNVMVRDGKPYMIDFQGGRRGPVCYDVASFVYHARASYSKILREKMIEAYLESLSAYVKVDEVAFMKQLKLFRLFRLLQVLGAYGFRGWSEHKAAFVVSIPKAVAELKELLGENLEEYPYLIQTLRRLVELPRLSNPGSVYDGLEVKVYSFSFKKGIPEDPSGNGGGYVFDCRSIHNPGRYKEYKQLTGSDSEVIRFLEDDGEISRYLEHVYGVVEPHVETYMRRGFTNLMVSFGCTGGQHRSVYCAEHLARHLAAKYPGIRVRLIHREQGIDELLGCQKK